jgi:hypothetical protein
MAEVESANERTGLTAEDVVSVQVFLRAAKCSYVPRQDAGELAVSGTTQWKVVASSGTRAVLILRDILHAKPTRGVEGEEEVLSVTVETEAQIELRRPIASLEKEDQIALVEACRPYNLEIIAYLTGRMGIRPLMLPVGLSASDALEFGAGLEGGNGGGEPAVSS